MQSTPIVLCFDIVLLTAAAAAYPLTEIHKETHLQFLSTVYGLMSPQLLIQYESSLQTYFNNQKKASDCALVQFHKGNSRGQPSAAAAAAATSASRASMQNVLRNKISNRGQSSCKASDQHGIRGTRHFERTALLSNDTASAAVELRLDTLGVG